MMIVKTFSLLLATLAVGTIAAPSGHTLTSKASGTKVRDDSPICTVAVPVNNPTYPINDFTYVSPSTNWISYSVNKDWYNAHFVSGPHYIAATVGTDPYGAFKCQYTCNAAGNCNSFFVWHENIGSSNEHANCVLFDAVFQPSVFEQSTGTMSSGGYDRICHD